MTFICTQLDQDQALYWKSKNLRLKNFQNKVYSNALFAYIAIVHTYKYAKLVTTFPDNAMADLT